MTFLRPLCILAGLALTFSLEVQAADQAHALRAGSGGVVFHYAVMPAEIVLGPTSPATHNGARQGTSHVMVAVFDASTNERIAVTEVTASVSRGRSPPVKSASNPWPSRTDPYMAASSSWTRPACTPCASRPHGQAPQLPSAPSSNIACRRRDAANSDGVSTLAAGPSASGRCGALQRCHSFTSLSQA
jgi:hypothetical protein